MLLWYLYGNLFEYVFSFWSQLCLHNTWMTPFTPFLWEYLCPKFLKPKFLFTQIGWLAGLDWAWQSYDSLNFIKLHLFLTYLPTFLPSYLPNFWSWHYSAQWTWQWNKSPFPPLSTLVTKGRSAWPYSLRGSVPLIFNLSPNLYTGW